MISWPEGDNFVKKELNISGSSGKAPVYVGKIKGENEENWGDGEAEETEQKNDEGKEEDV